MKILDIHDLFPALGTGVTFRGGRSFHPRKKGPGRIGTRKQ